MAKWSSDSIILTSVGEQILAKVASGIGSITVTRIVSGKSSVGLAQLSKLTKIPNEGQEFVIQRVESSEDGSAIDIQLTNQDITEEYSLWQIGVYVLHQDYSGEQLYYVAQATTPDIIPLPTETPVTMNYSLFMQHSGQASVTITPEWSGLATQKVFDEHKNAVLTDANGIHGMKYVAPKSESEDGVLYYSDAEGNWIEIETGAKMEKTVVNFEEATKIENIKGGELVPTLFGKIKHLFEFVLGFEEESTDAKDVDTIDADTLGGIDANDYALRSDYNGLICVLVSTNWTKGSDGTYSYKIQYPSLTGNEFFDMSLYDDGTATQAQIDAFADYVTRVDINAGEIVFQASARPSVTFSVILRGMCTLSEAVVTNLSELMAKYDSLEARVTALENK